MKVEAKYFERIDDEKVRCTLCPHFCKLKDEQVGLCMMRQNLDGTLYEVKYGNTISVTMDPIEKKPLYHFYPGKDILSIGPNGCNLSCDFCQNWEISQRPAPTREYSPEEMVEMTKDYDSIGIAYTYTEPLVWYRYIMDTGKLIKDEGMVNVLVTNGYINEEPLREMLPLIDGMNVDLKTMKDEFYKKRCNGSLEPVLNTLLTVKDNTHIEITNLIVTGWNDGEEDVRKLAEWVAENIGEETPLHISRYFPRHKATDPQTPVEVMEMAHSVASEYLEYVYLGNISVKGPSHTKCQNCGNTLIKRWGYTVEVNGLNGTKCSQCGEETNIAN